jgi:integrase
VGAPRVDRSGLWASSGEILAVKTTMIVEQANRLKVNTGISVESGVLVDKRLKTKRSRRTVAIPDRRIGAVRRFRQEHGVAAISGLLFSSRTSGLADPESFTQAVRRPLKPRLVDIVGDIDWTPHTLRHTFATRLCRRTSRLRRSAIFSATSRPHSRSSVTRTGWTATAAAHKRGHGGAGSVRCPINRRQVDGVHELAQPTLTWAY